ncbi:MAG: AraC family transcriptional regulator, partial [Deltaproteobacteria bacterium]|nr:AraC family transcriptional regulator [Deltaproteobacteria bacterium]
MSHARTVRARPVALVAALATIGATLAPAMAAPARKPAPAAPIDPYGAPAPGPAPAPAPVDPYGPAPNPAPAPAPNPAPA